MKTLANRVQRIEPSPTLAITAKAAAMRAEGKDVIGLGAGEPDFDTPTHIKEAAIKAIHDGKTKYTPVDGTAELKQAIIDKFQRDNGHSYAPNQVMASSGGKQCLYNLCQALLSEGDEVVVPAPYWVSYPAMVKLADATPVILSAGIEQQYKITAEQLDAVITPKTKLVFLNSPSNPTGMAYSKKELQAIAQVLLKHPHIYVATDDMYEHILWTEEPFHNILMVCPELYDRTIVFNGVSKAYSMTGWRIGYCGGPVEIIAAMKKVQSQSTSNPASISQAAATAALAGPQDEVKKMVTAFKKRHDLVFGLLNEIPNVHCLPADGTFYMFPHLKTIKDDLVWCEQLLTEKGVAVVPGTAFGAPGCFRLSFATSENQLTEALNRIKDFVG